jgi:transposase-like protein
MTTSLNNKIFQDETAAREYLEAQRWPNGAFCPHCGAVENIRKMEGKSHRPGLYQCNGCREHFTVTVGTLYERSHIPLHKWLLATYLLCSSKKGMSANQLHRMLGITYKSAWFMCHRIREAMKPSDSPLGGEGKTVEIDETYVGGKRRGLFREKYVDQGRSQKSKTPVVSLIERGGNAKSFVVDSVKGHILKGLAYDNVEMTSHIMTDSFVSYKGLKGDFASHQAVDHSKEYVRGIVHVNFAESYFSLLKRGIMGTFHHISADHMQRYLNEFDYRWNTRKVDTSTALNGVLKGAIGKRLTYRRIDDKAA